MTRFLKNYTFVDYATQCYLVFVGALILGFHNSTVPEWSWLLLIHAALLSLVHGLIQWHARKPAAQPLNFLRHFYPVILYVFFFAETGRLNRMFVTEFQDPVVIRLEQAIFGGQPGIEFMQRFPSLLISELLYAAYFSYYIMISGIGIALFLRDRRQFFHYVSVLSFVFYCCYTIYIFLPVCGPRVFLNEFPEYNLPADLHALVPVAYYPDSVKAGPFFKVMGIIYAVFEAPGAAFPSSHVAAALCTLFFSLKYLPRVFPAHSVAVFLLCLSTIYGRYHYVVDVLAGMLAACLLVPLGNALYLRGTDHQGGGRESQTQPTGDELEPLAR